MKRTNLRLRTVLLFSLVSSTVLVIAAILTGVTARAAEAEAAKRYTKAVLIHFEGPITPLLEQYFYRKLETAKEREADLLIIEIESPGGFLEASLDIADRLRNLSWARTVAYIPKQALSGAAVAALGCDDIVMGPQATLGDAGPIVAGEDGLFRHAPEKTRSFLVSQLRDLAQAKGRSPALAAAMVDMDLVVYEARNKQTGATQFLSEKDIAVADNPADWEKIKPVPETGGKSFLTVNGLRAVDLQLANANAANRDELKKRYGLQGDLIVLKPTAVDTAVTILNLPIVTGLLFVIGLVALYIEFSAPGIGMGGLIAGLCFALFFWSRFLGGTSGWLEVILFGAGLVFLAMEFFVIPGFGVAGLTGLLLIFASILMASQHFVIPQTTMQWSMSLSSILVLGGSGLTFLLVAAVLSHYFEALPVLSSLVLQTPDAQAERAAGDKDGGKAPLSDPHAHRFPIQAGDWGLADSPLRPAGKARFGEHYVDVVADGLFVDKGKQICVIEVSGNRVVVREIE